MRRKFLRDSIICFLPLVIALWITFQAYSRFQKGEGGFKLGVDLVGGETLVYEVDPELTQELRNTSGRTRGGNAGISTDEMARLAAALKRRIDPADLKNVTIRPVGTSRIEIILPTGGNTATGKSDLTMGEIDEVKQLIRQVGSLEFRIIANDFDDKRAIDDAIEQIKDPNRQKSLSERALKGLPPEAPVSYGDPYEVHGEAANYAWVEIGQEERLSLGLNNDAEFSPNAFSFWKPVADARLKGEAYLKIEDRGGSRYSYLVFSRKCESRKLTEEQRTEKKYEYFMLTRSSDSLKIGGNITINANAEPNTDQNGSGWQINFTLNAEGGRKFGQITKRNRPSNNGSDASTGQIYRQLGIILDGMLKSAPTLQSMLSEHGRITGNFTQKSAEQLSMILRSGALTAVLKPQPVSENIIGPTLGADTIRAGTQAVIWAFLAILIFMLIYYRFAGLVATIALFANLFLTVGFMVLVNATFTLPGLAGLVLMLGMAVDANVLIYERVREERDRGLTLITAIRQGYDRAFPTIIDTHLSSIFTAIVLYVVGNDQLKGFGVSLTAGLIISLFTSLYMTRFLFDLWLSKRWLTNLAMMRFFTRPNIDFMRIRYIMFVTTGALTLIGISLFLLRGKDGLNVDFIGGTTYGGQLQVGKELEIEDLRSFLSDEQQKERLNVEKVEEKEDPSGVYKNFYTIFYKDGTQESLTLNNTPSGSTPEARSENVKQRASILPDWSVEQVFRSDSSGTKSRNFNVRTTEKEPELVQIAIDRLFQKNGESFLAKSDFKIEHDNKSNSWTLTLTDPVSGEPAPATISYIKLLLDREFHSRYPTIDVQEPFDVSGEGEAVEGRFAKIRVIPISGSSIKPLADVKTVDSIIEKARTAFLARPQPERLETFDSTLAKTTQNRATYAILASWAAILIYLWFRFGNWTFGLAAVICLIHDLFFTLGAIALCHYLHVSFLGKMFLIQDFKIDLPAVAALLTLVGYSVNDTIVVFDRIREVRGKNPILTSQMINDSVNQTLSRTLLTSLATWLVVIVLYLFGGEGVHLFAFVMVIGVIVGTYSSIYIASPLLLIFGEGKHHLPQTGTLSRDTGVIASAK